MNEGELTEAIEELPLRLLALLHALIDFIPMPNSDNVDFVTGLDPVNDSIFVHTVGSKSVQRASQTFTDGPIIEDVAATKD